MAINNIEIVAPVDHRLDGNFPALFQWQERIKSCRVHLVWKRRCFPAELEHSILARTESPMPPNGESD